MPKHKSYKLVNRPKKQTCDYPEPYLSNVTKDRERLKGDNNG